MSILAITPNITTGGTVQASDVLTLYYAINGGLDSTNIGPGTITGANIAANTVGFGNLKTANQSFAVQQFVAAHNGEADVILSSGAASFIPGIATDGTAGADAFIGELSTGAAAADMIPWTAKQTGATVQAILNFGIFCGTTTGVTSVIVSIYYIQSSPPYDMGDGEVPLFSFVMYDAPGHVQAVSHSPDPPWHQPHTKPRLKLPHTFAEAAGDPAKMAELTTALDSMTSKMSEMKSIIASSGSVNPEMAQNVNSRLSALGDAVFIKPPTDAKAKNEFMHTIPHPFLSNDLTGKQVVMLQPVGKMAERMGVLHAANEHLGALMTKGYITAEEDASNSKLSGPPGVPIWTAKWKNTR